MASEIVMNPRKLTEVLIRCYGFFLLLMQLGGLVGTVASIAGVAQNDPNRAFYLGQLETGLVAAVIRLGIYALFFVRARELSSWLLPKDESVVLSGDPFSLALPALQITGLIFCTDAIAGLLPLIQNYKQHLDGAGTIIALDGKFWGEAWGIFVHLLVGFLLFRTPTWLVERMRRYSEDGR